jgi:hypothetical protein
LEVHWLAAAAAEAAAAKAAAAAAAAAGRAMRRRTNRQNMLLLLGFKFHETKAKKLQYYFVKHLNHISAAFPDSFG